MAADQLVEKVKFANDLVQKIQDSIKEDFEDTANLIAEGFPDSLIAGLAAGGDLTSAGRSAVLAAGLVSRTVVDKVGIARYTVINALELAVKTAKDFTEFFYIGQTEIDMARREAIQDLVNKLGDAQERWWAVNERVRELDDAQRALRALIAQGDRIQAERQVFRQRAAAVALSGDWAWMEAPMAALRRRCQQLLAMLDRSDRPWRFLAPADGAFYGLLELDSPLSADQAMERLVREHGVAVVSGSSFGLEGCCLRISYGMLEGEAFTTAIERLASGLEALAREGASTTPW
jgi:hypothetical protein